VLLLSRDKSRIASEQQKILAATLPRGRLELFPGYGHGINLLQPERCARAALDFWARGRSGGPMKLGVLQLRARTNSADNG